MDSDAITKLIHKLIPLFIDVKVSKFYRNPRGDLLLVTLCLINVTSRSELSEPNAFQLSICRDVDSIFDKIKCTLSGIFNFSIYKEAEICHLSYRQRYVR